MDNQPNKKRSLISPIQIKPKRRKISPFRTLSYPADFAKFINAQTRSIKYYGGQRKINSEKPGVYEEIIDLRTKIAMVNDSLYELIKERIKEKKPYFLAAILVNEQIHNKETNQTIQALGRHYHDAAYLIEWIFNDYFQRKPDRKDPVTNQSIFGPIYFFRVTKLEEPIEYFSSEFELKQNNQTAQYMCALLKSKMENPKDMLHLAHSYHFALGTLKNFEEAKTYYKKCKNLGYIEGANGLGNVYLEQDKYKKAEQEYIRASQNDAEGHLNLVYLFGIEQSTLSIDEIITRFYEAKKDKSLLTDYVKTHPDRWTVITETLQKLEIKIPNITLQSNNHFWNNLLQENDYDITDNDNEEEDDDENNEQNENNTEMQSSALIWMPNYQSSDEEDTQEQTFETNDYDALEGVPLLFQQEQSTQAPSLLDEVINAMEQDTASNEHEWPNLSQTEQEQLNTMVSQAPAQTNQTIQSAIDSALSNQVSTDQNNEWQEIDEQLDNLQKTVRDDTSTD